MKNLNEKRAEAVSLRKEGLSLNEIVKRLHIAKSTASDWLRNIKLSEIAQERLMEKQVIGRIKAMRKREENRIEQIRLYKQLAKNELESISFSKFLIKLSCAFLWWCEGNKKDSFVRFTNSDKTLISNFLHLLRHGFMLDERKFRVLMHLHSYHDEEKQKFFWSNVTKIPPSQFHRSFKKQNSGKRKHKDYQGCIAVTYYDARIAKELEAIYNAFTLYIPRGIR